MVQRKKNGKSSKGLLHEAARVVGTALGSIAAAVPKPSGSEGDAAPEAPKHRTKPARNPRSGIKRRRTTSPARGKSSATRARKRN